MCGRTGELGGLASITIYLEVRQGNLWIDDGAEENQIQITMQ